MEFAYLHPWDVLPWLAGDLFLALTLLEGPLEGCFILDILSKSKRKDEETDFIQSSQVHDLDILIFANESLYLFEYCAWKTYLAR